MGKDLKGKELGRGYTQCTNGRYKYSFRLDSGKQTAVYGASVAECKRNYTAAIKAYEEGLTAGNKKITTAAYFDEWIENLKTNSRVKGSTCNNYNQHWKKHIKPAFGTTKLVMVTPPMARKFQRDLKDKGLKPKTVNSITDVAHHLFEDAVRDGIIQKNPFSVLTPVPMEINEDGEVVKRDNNRALSSDEVTWFVEAMKESFYYNATRLLFATGMRSGELRGLKWSDCDTKNGVLHIRRTATVDADNKLTFNTPKSERGRRDIPLNDEIKSIIEDHRKEARMMQGNVIQMDGFMFTSVTGKVISRNVLKSAFTHGSERVRKAGHPEFKNISPHATRHTFITNWLLAGKNIYVLKDITGHSPAAKVTEAVYLDRSQNAMNEAMKDWKVI